jgi:hypothetical protein
MISTDHILDNALCLHRIIVRLGDLDLDPNVPDGASPIDMAIKKSIIHPEYHGEGVIKNDIALLQLQNAVEYTSKRDNVIIFCNHICIHFTNFEISFYRRKYSTDLLACRREILSRFILFW